MSSDTGLYTAYISLGAQALIPIILGSFQSLKTPASVLARRKKSKRRDNTLLLLGNDDDEDSELDDEIFEETLGWADSLVFPIFGSIALLGLWALLKYVGPEWINFVLGIYFSGAGMFAVQTTFSSIVTYILRISGQHTPTYHIRISSGIRQIFHLPISLPSLALVPLSIILPALYIPLGRPWLLSNLLALCLGTTTLAILRLDSFLTAFILLAVLLVYDIFWVFATPVMVTVAKGIDAPIKILAPKSHTSDFAMLGLGDIVIPGLVIALCLRFDLHRAALRYPKADLTPRSRFGKGYFLVALTSYIFGLGTTMVVMHYTRHAQPALLYLSPACTLGPIFLALARREFALLWGFSDAPIDIDEQVRDDTIEPPSEAAQRAREAIKDDNVAEVAKGVSEHVEVPTPPPVEEDDSWMNEPTEAGGKARKRKSGKKK